MHRRNKLAVAIRMELFFVLATTLAVQSHATTDTVQSHVAVADVPSATCQAQMDRWCNLPGKCPIVTPARPQCTAPLFAANSSGVMHGPGKSHQYRCFSGASLNANKTKYTSGGCYCSGTADALRRILCICEHGNRSTWNQKHNNCTVPV